MLLEAFLAGCIVSTSLNIIIYNYYKDVSSGESLNYVTSEVIKEDEEDE